MHGRGLPGGGRARLLARRPQSAACPPTSRSRDGVLPRQLRPRPVGRGRRPAASAARPPTGSTRSSGRRRDDDRLRAPRHRRPLRRRRRRRRRPSRPRCPTHAIVRNGSRGMLWLEPLVEVDRRRPGRLRAGHRDDVAGAGARRCSTAASTRCASASSTSSVAGQPARGSRSPGSASSTRWTPTTTAHGGLAGLQRAAGQWRASRSSRRSSTSGLRGRGGAGFPAGIKWQTVAHGRGRPRSSSAATPTRATAAPSPTGC